MGRHSGRPREIEIWFTRLDGRYYLIAEHRARAQWVRNLLADPAVRVRVGRTTFHARARVVDARIEDGLARAVRKLSETKYRWGDGLVVELTPSLDHSGTPTPGGGRRRAERGLGRGRRDPFPPRDRGPRAQDGAQPRGDARPPTAWSSDPSRGRAPPATVRLHATGHGLGPPSDTPGRAD